VFSYVQMSTATQLQGDSLRHQTQLFEQYSAEHGLDLDEDAIGVSAFDGSNIVHYLVALSVVPDAIACGCILPPGQIAQISLVPRRVESRPIDRVGPPPKMIRLEGDSP
jgi:hypothetical protein